MLTGTRWKTFASYSKEKPVWPFYLNSFNSDSEIIRQECNEVSVSGNLFTQKENWLCCDIRYFINTL